MLLSHGLHYNILTFTVKHTSQHRRTIERRLNFLVPAMGCGASKEDIAEPRSMQQSHGRNNKLHLKDKAASKPNEITTCALDGSKCICSLSNNIPSAELNNSPSPPSVLIHTPHQALSSDEDNEDDDEDDEDDFGPSFEFPSKVLSIVDEEDNNNASQTTALAALSGGEKAVTDKELEERVEATLAADGGELILPEQSEECCALGVLSQSAILQALLSTGPVITQQITLGSDLSSARVGHVAVISGPEPIHWETPLRKAEIIDLDEEPNAGESLMLENTPEQQENQPADDHALKLEADSVASLKPEEEQPKQYPKLPEDANNTLKTLSAGLEPRKGKLPPLTIVPPILVEIPADPFAKPAFPIVIKQDLMEVKVAPTVEQIEDLSADRTPEPPALPESADEDNHEDKRSKSSLVTEHCEDGTPTPATRSSADSGWRSPHREVNDPDIENIVLLESTGSPELDSLPLLSTLDCHGIHMDKKDLISPSLRLISS